MVGKAAADTDGNAVAGTIVGCKTLAVGVGNAGAWLGRGVTAAAGVHPASARQRAEMRVTTQEERMGKGNSRDGADKDTRACLLSPSIVGRSKSITHMGDSSRGS
jgi:F0F1-type ATP synthase membrane subunit c/vacuolar-type H+-ATPase subunit K